VTEQPQDLSSTPGTGAPPLGAQPTAGSRPVDYTSAVQGQSLTQRPEVLIAATFVGGFILASILKRLAK
jgi:hypothetical protein